MKFSLDKLVDGKEYYVYALRISRSGKASRKIIPQIAKFKKDRGTRGSFYNEKGKYLGETWYTYFNVFDNYEEAVEEWNMQLQNILDKVTSEFETRIKNISSLKI